MITLTELYELAIGHYEWLMLNGNAIICAVTCGRLLSFRRGKARHSVLMSLLAWLLVIATAAVPIRVMTGEYFYTDWAEVLINLVLCVAVLRSRGNVGRLLKGKKNEYESDWPRPDKEV